MSLFVSAAVLAGCAADTSQIRATHVSAFQYDGHTCEQLRGEAARITRKATEVGRRVDKEAADDDAQAGIAVIFWPSLFFLEGEETANTREYADLKGHMNAIEEASIRKECGIEFKPLPEGQMHNVDIEES